MIFLLPFLLLTSPSPEYDPSDYRQELTEVLAEAVKDEVITYKEALAISDSCFSCTLNGCFSLVVLCTSYMTTSSSSPFLP